MSPPAEFVQPPDKPFDVAVIGGGIAGLTLTLHLLAKRVPTALYEAAPHFGEIGAGVSFGPNATRAMSLISPHVRAAFEARATRNLWADKKDVWFDFRWGEDCGGTRNPGEKFCTLVCEGGQASVHRAHFLDEMVKLLPEGVAKFGKRAVEVEQDAEGVLVKFQDGTTARHTALVGCDGIKSRMRSLLLGADHPAANAVFSGKYAYRGLIPMEKASELLGEEYSKNSQMYCGRHGHILTFSIEKGKTMNVVAFHSRAEWTSEEWVVPMKEEDLFSDYEGWSSTVHSILKLMQHPDVWALFDHPPAPTYFKDRVCLVGDAAHASTPHKGSGAGMAVEDAYILGSLIGDLKDSSQIPSAFKAYDKVRIGRTQRLVAESRDHGRLYDLELVGDDPGRLSETLHSRMGWVWDHDLTRELDEAKGYMRAKSNPSSIDRPNL